MRFDHGAVYWSPKTGANPVTGAIYDAWASLGYERGLLGLPTSGEIPEPQWIVQNFQHGTLNFDRQNGTVTRVVDGVAVEIPPPPASGPPVQLERFTPIGAIAAIRVPTAFDGSVRRRRVIVPDDQRHQRSSTQASPSSVLGAVTSSAAESTSGCALPIATP